MTLTTTDPAAFAAAVAGVLAAFRDRVALRVHETRAATEAADLQTRLAAVEEKARALDHEAAAALARIKALQAGDRPDAGETIAEMAALDRQAEACQRETGVCLKVADELRRRLQVAQSAVIAEAAKIAAAVRAEFSAETAQERDELLASLPSDALLRLAAIAEARRRVENRGDALAFDQGAPLMAGHDYTARATGKPVIR
jgi:hypothetical protein